MDTSTSPATVILGPWYDPHTTEVPPIYREVQTHNWHGATDWQSKIPVLRCTLDIGFGAQVVVLHAPSKPHLFLVKGQWGMSDRFHDPYQWRVDWGADVEDVEPFVRVEVLGSPYPKTVTRVDHGNWTNLYKTTTRQEIDAYSADSRSALAKGANHATIPYNYLKVRVTLLDGSASTEVELRFERTPTGTVDLAQSRKGHLHVTGSFFGQAPVWTESVTDYQSFHDVLTRLAVPEGPEALWAWYLKSRGCTWDKRDVGGIKAVEARKDIKPNLDRLLGEEPTLASFLAFLHDKKTSEKTSNNKLLTAFLLRNGLDYDKLRDGIRTALNNAPNCAPEYEGSYSRTPVGRSICLTLDGAADKIAEDKAKSQWQFAKSTRAKAEVLGIDATRHPLLLARIEKGDIPLALFHEVGQEDNLINVEFNLWERAFARPGWAPVLCEIAKNAAGRAKYSKRVTSYIAFLFRIEKYLDRNAPRPKSKKSTGWRAMPKYVQSQSELEMAEATEEGTVKTRSAMTPVADNEAGTITVPYVAMSISGIRTTWCYSETYFVAEEGAEDPVFPLGGCYESDLAEKLNGRDDYGVCFFTLTGSDQNTGYPTFLIIFERTSAHGTRVHFHRVHPSRKRGPNGTETPPNRLIEECYRYMAGNIRAEEILHQQGDILLVKAAGPGKSVDDPAGVLVYGFENHSFVGGTVDGVTEPVRLVRSQAKARGNLLGWLHAPTGMRMPHPEHEPVEGITPGWYEIRRCKSWEANPTSVWSYNFD